MPEIINYLLGGIIMTLTPILFAKIVLNKKIQVNVIEFIIICLFGLITYVLSFEYLESTIKTLCMFLINIFLIKFLFKKSYGRALIVAFLYLVLLLIPDVLLLVIATLVIGIDKEIYAEVFAGTILANLAVSLLLVLITFLMKKILRKIMKYRMEETKRLILFSIFTLVFVVIAFNKFINSYGVTGNTIGYIITIVVFLVILFTSYKQKIDNDNLISRYDKLLDFLTQYEKEIENQRILRHENKNQLIIIKSKIFDHEDKSNIVEYIDSILEENSKEFNEAKYAKYQYLPNNGLKALFYFKANSAENLGINVDINVSSKISKSFLNNLRTNNFKDLGKIVGVYLDNAIEASFLSVEKLLGIEVYMINDNIEIIISNSYRGEIDLKRIGKAVFSTKGRDRGHGLLVVKKIMNNNKMFEGETEVTDRLYIQKLIIKKPIKFK